MQKTVLSTADVARLFSVTETTVKRWADEGALRCQKTPGGHRKFEMRYVIEFSKVHNFEPIGALELDEQDTNAHRIQMAILNRDHMTLANVFVDKALSPDETDLYSFLSYLYEHHLELWEIYDLVIAPGLSEIGERWARGEVGISKEHRASYETLDALSKLQAEIHRRPGENSSVVCACVDEESHEIGLRCVANIFESEGWRVYYLGGRTPYESIITTVKEVRPTAVCLTSLVPSSVDMLKKHLKEIYSQAKPSGATVILRAGVLGANNGEGIFLDLTLRSAKEVYDYIHQTRSATVKKIESADAMKRPRGHAS